jgi:hypothetical protein
MYTVKALNSDTTLRYCRDYKHDLSGNIVSIRKHKNANSLIKVNKFMYKSSRLDHFNVYDNENILIEKRHFYYENNVLKK